MDVKLWEVWTEGYKSSDGDVKAWRLESPNNESGKWEGESFQSACVNAMKSLSWEDIHKHYNANTNRYWLCGFFDNEQDARRFNG